MVRQMPKELTLDLGKGIKLEMVLIPAGEFMMGSPDSDKDAPAAEHPQHRVPDCRICLFSSWLKPHICIVVVILLFSPKHNQVFCMSELSEK